MLQDIDKVSNNSRNPTRVAIFKHIRYETLDKVDKQKVEQIITDMMVNLKYTPIELGKELPQEWYNKIDPKWKQEFTTKNKMREDTLA